METYAVSRATVRRAIEPLVAEGVLRRVQGKGTFVARPRVQSHLHLASFTQDMRRRGKAPTTRVVRVEAVAPPPEVADWFGLARSGRPGGSSGSDCASGEPMAFEAGWYSPRLLPGLDRHDLGGSLYELFAPGVRPARRHRGADGARGDGRRHDLAHDLDVEAGIPC